MGHWYDGHIMALVLTKSYQKFSFVAEHNNLGVPTHAPMRSAIELVGPGPDKAMVRCSFAFLYYL